MSPPRVGLYLRVSTQDQNCDLQRSELMEYAKSRGFQIIDVYEDKATGTNANRPKFKALMNAARERRFDLVLIWKLDRFARSLRDLVNHLQELSDVGVAVISLRDHLDLSSSSGRLMMHLLGAFSEFEAAMIRERVRAGIANAKAKGKRLGRPVTTDYEQVRSLRRDGHSLASIGRRLGISKGGVSKILKKQAS